MVDKRAAFVGLAVVVVGRANDHIVVAVAVYVARGRDGRAEVGVFLAALRSPGGAGGKPRSRSVKDQSLSLIRLAVVIVRGSHDHIVVAVAVHIARGGDGRPEVGTCLVAVSDPRPRRQGLSV